MCAFIDSIGMSSFCIRIGTRAPIPFVPPSSAGRLAQTRFIDLVAILAPIARPGAESQGTGASGKSSVDERASPALDLEAAIRLPRWRFFHFSAMQRPLGSFISHMTRRRWSRPGNESVAKVAHSHCRSARANDAACRRADNQSREEYCDLRRVDYMAQT